MPSPLKNQPPLNIARFTGFFIECVLTGMFSFVSTPTSDYADHYIITGVYWVHFYLYVESVRKRSKSAGQNLFKTPMFAVGATLFIIATGVRLFLHFEFGYSLTCCRCLKHFIVLVISSFIAFVNCVTTDTPFDQRGYLSLSPHWIIAYSSIYIAIPVVADAFLVCIREIPRCSY